MRHHIAAAADILGRIFADRSYGNLALLAKDVTPMTAKLVYGVLEKNIRLEYILSQLIDKRPKPYVYLLLKIGSYTLTELDDVPTFAAVSECVEAARAAGKGGVCGFINAVLKKVAAGAYALPEEGDKDYLSVTYCKPQWFIDRLKAERGEEQTLRIISAESEDGVHIRANSRVTDIRKVAERLQKKGAACRMSGAGGAVCRIDDTVKKMFLGGEITYQSPSSMLAVDALGVGRDSRVLDICSAPGGKAVYASEKCIEGSVTACDVHPHRTELIKKYAKRMSAENVAAVTADATVFRPEWEGEFDRVLVDAPCSCFGTFLKHPDVFLFKDESDISELAELQRSILDNAVRYLRRGGILVYSTCTLFDEENSENAKYIESKGLLPLALDGEKSNTKSLIPDREWDGFFIARYTK